MEPDVDCDASFRIDMLCILALFKNIKRGAAKTHKCQRMLNFSRGSDLGLPQQSLKPMKTPFEDCGKL